MDKRGKRDSLETHEVGDILCEQCGKIIRYDSWSMRKARGNEDWEKCFDCRATRTFKISYRHKILGLITCYVHQGDVDDDLNPLDAEGNLFRPGIRVCGHKDCVTVGHILPDKPEEMGVQDV